MDHFHYIEGFCIYLHPSMLTELILIYCEFELQ